METFLQFLLFKHYFFFHDDDGWQQVMIDDNLMVMKPIYRQLKKWRHLQT